MTLGCYSINLIVFYWCLSTASGIAHDSTGVRQLVFQRRRGGVIEIKLVEYLVKVLAIEQWGRMRKPSYKINQHIINRVRHNITLIQR